MSTGVNLERWRCELTIMSQLIIISKGFKVDVRPEQLMESRRGSEMDSRPTRPMSRSAPRDTY